MSIDSATGVISWTPTESQAGGYTITFRASDNGTPALTATSQFQVTVTGSGAELAISALSNNRVQVTIDPRPGRQFQLQRSTNLITWESVVNVPQQETSYIHIEPMNTPHRFYRLFSP